MILWLNFDTQDKKQIKKKTKRKFVESSLCCHLMFVLTKQFDLILAFRVQLKNIEKSEKDWMLNGELSEDCF